MTQTLNDQNSHSEAMTQQDPKRCTRELSLEPKHTDTWQQPEKRKRSDVPFVCGGGV